MRDGDAPRTSSGPYDLDSRLIHAMSAIEQHLRATYGRSHRQSGREVRRDRNAESFTELLQSAIAQKVMGTPLAEELETLWRIRSVLAHENRMGAPPITATPSGVVRAEQIGEALLGEPLARLSMFATDPARVVTVTADTSVGAAVTVMAEGDFTSLPVIDEHGRCTALLSSQDVVTWLGRHLGQDGIVENTTVREVMHLAGDDFAFVARNLPQREARSWFVDHTQRTGEPLMALLITFQGTEREPLLGIVTPWDLPYLTPPALERPSVVEAG